MIKDKSQNTEKISGIEWKVVDFGDFVVVHPDDLTGHTKPDDLKCPCKPTIHETEARPMYVHNLIEN